MKHSTKPKVICGQTVWFQGDPNENKSNLKHHREGAVACDENGKIVWSGAKSDMPDDYAEFETLDVGEQLVMPGFVDPHIHFPQYRMLASPGVDLVDWLTRFTFAEEARYADKQHCEDAAELFLDNLVANGTTSCMAFSSVHKVAADTLFQAASNRNMALTTGKTMMDRAAPIAVLDTAEQGGLDSQALIDKWHGNERLTYAITPRFAVTSSEAQLQVSGELLKANPSCLMQTHLSESAGEMAIIARDFPNDLDYTQVYDRFGLLGETSVFGHGIHLSQRELARLAETGSAIAHCPTSNTFLGSGLMNLEERNRFGISVGIASDIGGGTSYSMLTTMAEAYKIALLNGHKTTAIELFYRSTLGNANILHRQNEIGSLAVGNDADIVVLDPCATVQLKARQALSTSLEDVLFSLMFLGDDRAVSEVFIAGKPQLQSHA